MDLHRTSRAALLAVLFAAVLAPVRAQVPPEPDSGTTRAQRFIVQIEPSTNWRPRGGEVQFTIRPQQEPNDRYVVHSVSARFCWSRQISPPRCAAQSVEARVNSFKSNERGIVYTALVPRNLPGDEGGFVSRVLGKSEVQSTSFGAVPVAWLETTIETEDTRATNEKIKLSTEYYFNDIGITSTWLAFAGSVVATTIAILSLRALVKYLAGRRSYSWLKILLSDGTYTISLSQTQIMAWTFVVFAGGWYVLILAGTLIGLPDNMLALLGIQSATTVIARSPDLPDRKRLKHRKDGTSRPREPQWSDMIAMLSPDNRGDFLEVDVTRVQALIATGLAISYVFLSIFNNYEIPDIPRNFLILMGISNGTYLAGRLIPPHKPDATDAPRGPAPGDQTSPQQRSQPQTPGKPE